MKQGHNHNENHSSPPRIVQRGLTSIGFLRHVEDDSVQTRKMVDNINHHSSLDNVWDGGMRVIVSWNHLKQNPSTLCATTSFGRNYCVASLQFISSSSSPHGSLIQTNRHNIPNPPQNCGIQPYRIKTYRSGLSLSN